MQLKCGKSCSVVPSQRWALSGCERCKAVTEHHFSTCYISLNVVFSISDWAKPKVWGSTTVADAAAHFRPPTKLHLAYGVECLIWLSTRSNTHTRTPRPLLFSLMWVKLRSIWQRQDQAGSGKGFGKKTHYDSGLSVSEKGQRWNKMLDLWTTGTGEKVSDPWRRNNIHRKTGKPTVEAIQFRGEIGDDILGFNTNRAHQLIKLVCNMLEGQFCSICESFHPRSHPAQGWDVFLLDKDRCLKNNPPLCPLLSFALQTWQQIIEKKQSKRKPVR